MSAPIHLIRLQPRRPNKRGLRIAVRIALGTLAIALLAMAAGIATQMAGV